MAVQAQYPSNVMNLPINSSISCNARNVVQQQQQQHDYSFQPQQQQPLELLHHPHILYNKPSTTNSLKRTREETSIVGGGGGGGGGLNVMNPYSLQSQSSSQLINLSQLHQQNAVSTGLTLSFHDKQQQRLQLHQSQQKQHQQKQQGSQLSLINEGLASQIKQHQHEIHQYLRTQEEQLRRTLTEKRQIHYRQLLLTAEEVMKQKLREKEAEVEKATRKNAELEARAAQLSVEAHVWQAKAKAQEAAAASLQVQLQQTIMCHRGENSGGGVSCAAEGQAEDACSAYIDPERIVEARGKCRACGKRVASVVVLPCRHLCLCTECDGVHLRACPFCLTPKNSTVQVFLS